MPVNNTFFIKKLEQFENCFALISQLTHMPYVECDEESGNDCVFLFSEEEKAKEAAAAYLDKKAVRVNVAKIPKANIKGFISSLYGLGINMVVLEEDENVEMPLELLAPPPDKKTLQNTKIPTINPDVQLTTLYFLQEARRKIIRSDDEKKKLREMEEEMAVNLFRSLFILAVDNTTEPETLPDGKKNYKLPMVKTQDGSSFVPVYTDMPEFQKMNARFRDMKFRLLPVPYQDLIRFVPAQAKGVVINPAGFDLVLTKEALQKLSEMYG